MSIDALRMLIVGLVLGGIVDEALRGELTQHYVITRLVAGATFLLVVELWLLWRRRVQRRGGVKHNPRVL